MNPSGNLELFGDEYASLLLNSSKDRTVSLIRDFGFRLAEAGIPASLVYLLHHRVLERLTSESPMLETERAVELLAEVMDAYYHPPMEDQPPSDFFGGVDGFYHQLFEEHPFPMWVFEESSLRFLTVNQAAIDVYGYSREEFLARTILDIRPEQDRDQVKGFVSQRPQTNPAKGEWRHRLKDGRLIDVEISSRRFRFDGKPARLVVARDISDQRKTREALDHSEERLRMAVEGAGIGTWHWDLTSQEVFWSPIYRTIFGHSPDEPAKLDTWRQLIHPEDFEHVQQTIQTAMSSPDGTFRLEYRFRHSTGHWRHALARGQVYFSSAGIPLRMEGILLDITERKNDEARLRLLELAIDKAQEVILITEAGENDPPGPRIIYVNEAFERMTGYSRAEAIGNSPRMLQGPGTSLETKTSVRQALEGWRSITVQMLNYRKDGSEFWAELAIQPIPDATGWYTHWLAIQRDITERLQEDERMRQAQKMEAIGQLTAGIAHNFNNLLTVIQGNVELIGRMTPLNQSLERKKSAILTAARRGADLVRQLMVISRGGSGEPRSLDVNALVGETGSMIERILPANIRFSLQLSEEPLFATLHEVEFSQSLLNLIVNARDALPHGGDLTISTSHREVSESKFNQAGTIFLLDREKVRPGLFVEVVVADTGTGMTETVRQRIFEPFFTTKPEGQGTGLGLATTLGFVTERGGFIEVTSEPGRGTVVRLLLPASESAQSNPEPNYPETGAFAGMTVLVADDDVEVQQLVRLILEERGFQVLTALDGAEAIRVATEFSGPIQLVLTDKAMPKLYGDAVIRLLSELRPDCRFILMSGDLGATGNLPPSVHFMSKPFGCDELIDAVRTALLEEPKCG